MPRVEGNCFCGLFDVKVVKEEEEGGEKEDHEENEADEKKKGIVGKISAAAL